MTTENGFESTRNGTVYWTLSLYIEPEKVAQTLGLDEGHRVPPSRFRRAQRLHSPSLALRNAIDPLLNDIADRETQGEIHEYLLAATDENPLGVENIERARELARQEEGLDFIMPDQISWSTEGVTFTARPEGLSGKRKVGLRRYWMSHNNGALTYHLSFSHHYGAEGRSPASYYFLSCLQKLAAPKEYSLSNTCLEALEARQAVLGKGRDQDVYATVFDDDLGIDPLDRIMVTDQGVSSKFWAFVRNRFEHDAKGVFARLEQSGLPASRRTMPYTSRLKPGFETSLLDMVPFIEVPGLKVPKSRFMFVFYDEDLFNRLMPVDPVSGEAIPRTQMIQKGCYKPYQDEIKKLIKSDNSGQVLLGEDYWAWVCQRPDYDGLLNTRTFSKKIDGGRATRIRDQQALQASIQSGTCWQSLDSEGKAISPPQKLYLPAFEAHRADCLDYMFLAGFNQNIIDFMNQDTSEILDSTDPIYPSTDISADERFFVRYANHRAMITYVPGSRSLEIGNDYIGTCPYAFLIHVLAMHNEMLGRAQEAASMKAIAQIKQMIVREKFRQAEQGINQIKLAEFERFERYRYVNPFRYNTERDVFDELERLRGINRKKDALIKAVENLEDHAADLQARRKGDNDKRLNILLGGLGIFGAGQMIYWIGEKAVGEAENAPPRALFMMESASADFGRFILSVTEFIVSTATFGFIGYFLWVLVLGRVAHAIGYRVNHLRQRRLDSSGRLMALGLIVLLGLGLIMMLPLTGGFWGGILRLFQHSSQWVVDLITALGRLFAILPTEPVAAQA